MKSQQVTPSPAKAAEDVPNNNKESEALVALRLRLLVGDPPYEIDPFLRTKVRKTGIPGIEELRAIGDYDAGAAANLLALDASLQIIDLLLERLK